MKTSLLTNNFSFPAAARWGQWRAVLLSALLSVLGAGAAHTQEAPGLAGMYKTHDLTYRVWGCNPAAQPGRVQMVGENGRVLYEQRSAGISLGGLFNLSGLPDGRYAFMVEIGRATHRFDVQLRTTAQRLAEVSGDQTLAGAHLLSVARPGQAER